MKLRLATFNLENLGERTGTAPLAERIAVLRPQLRRLDADVLCLQEVDAHEERPGARRTLDALDALLADTPYAGYSRAATEGPHGPFDVHNLVLLSRFPIADVRQLRHEMMAPPSYRMATAAPAAQVAAPVAWERPVLYVRLTLPGGRSLHTINVHLRAPTAAFIPGGKLDTFSWASCAQWAEGFYLSALKRGGQALEARLLIDSLFDRDAEALVAVLGDFNADAREVPVRTLLARPEDTGNLALAARALFPVDETVVRHHTVIHAGHRVTLDHILVSRTLLAALVRAEVHNRDLRDETVAAEGAPDSFHAPVAAEFALP